MEKHCQHHNCLSELRSDHDKILAEMNLLEKAVSSNDLDKEQVKSFLHFTESFAEPHHQKEEKVLFPELEKKGIPKEGGPMGVMILEHELKRGLVKELKKALDEGKEGKIREHAAAIVTLLRDHISKENDCLYPIAEQVLTGEDLDRLGHSCANL